MAFIVSYKLIKNCSSFIFAQVKFKKPFVLKELLIENYAAEGKSLAKIDGKVVFVENTVPGDIVDVQLFKNKKDWAEGFPLAFS